MTQDEPTTIGPSIPKLLVMFVLGNIIMTGGLLGIYVGAGKYVALVCAIPAACVGLVPLISLILRRPYIRFNASGLQVRNVFGTRSIQWEDVEGDFAIRATQNPIKLPGTGKIVVFNWTEAYKAKHGSKTTTLYSGFDTGILGAFELPYERLAALLNERKQEFVARGG
jgi:hypothetical protein